MSKRILTVMLSLSLLCGVLLSGCDSCEPKNTESIHEYWDAFEYSYKESEGNITHSYAKVVGLTESGKKQTYLIMPEKMNDSSVIWYGRADSFMSRFNIIDYGGNKALISDGPTPNRGLLQDTKFEWIYFKNVESTPVNNESFQSGRDGKVQVKDYPIIVPDSFDYDAKIRDSDGAIKEEYENIKYQHLSESIAEYKTNDGKMWSVFTNEKDYVFTGDIQFYNDEILIVATDEMQSVTFPEGVEKLERVEIVTSEYQKEDMKIKVYVSESTIISDKAFDDGIEIVRY